MNENEIHFEGKIAQKVIVEHAGKVLLVQDPREPNDIWELPGGRMNINENPYEAMKREFLEEMGVDISIGNVVHMEQFIQGNEGKRAFVIIYRAFLLIEDFSQFQTDKDEVSKIEWFTEEEVTKLELYPEYKRALDIYFSIK